MTEDTKQSAFKVLVTAQVIATGLVALSFRS